MKIGLRTKSARRSQSGEKDMLYTWPQLTWYFNDWRREHLMRRTRWGRTWVNSHNTWDILIAQHWSMEL